MLLYNRGLAAAGVGLGVASFAADGKAVPPNAPTRATGGGTATIPEHTLYVLLVLAMLAVGQQELLALTIGILLLLYRILYFFLS